MSYVFNCIPPVIIKTIVLPELIALILMNIIKKETVTYKVAILMTTYNAGLYLEQQLASIVAQTHNNWILCISDDGSTDDTLKVLSEFRNKWGAERVIIGTGPGKGFAQNFLSLVCNDEIKSDFYAYCDQDDIWQKDKLEAALQYLVQYDSHKAQLYGSRTLLVDEENKFIGYSQKFLKKPSLSNALVQNLAGGNTMVFNDVTRNLLTKVGVVPVVSHDWLTYLVVAACEGVMIYDEQSHLRYRQHSHNLVGSNSGLCNKLTRARKLLNGQFSQWVDLNLAALKSLEQHIPSTQKVKIDTFNNVRKGGIWGRCLAFKTTGVYRQNMLGNIGMFIGFLFKKI